VRASFFPSLSVVTCDRALNVLPIAITGGEDDNTSFHTVMRYGAFVEGGGKRAASGSARNYCEGQLFEVIRVDSGEGHLFDDIYISLHCLEKGSQTV
jgi:hypothetical protein